MDLAITISVSGAAVSVLTLILSYVRFGREVHVDDKNEMIRRLNECEKNHKDCQESLKNALLRFEHAEEEKIRYMKLYFESNNRSVKPEERRDKS